MAAHPASDAIASSLGLATEQDIQLTSWQPVSGGSIHQAWQVITSTNKHFFIKTNQAQALPIFQAEAVSLEKIEQHLTPENPISVPHVYAVGADKQYAWLVMTHIPFSRDTPQSEGLLGRGLALLHQQSAHNFGLNQDNFIGHTPQTNHQEHDWLTFFKKHRLQAQLIHAKKNGFYYHLEKEIENLYQILPLLFVDHQPNPSLLHGDLWSGNKAADTQGNPIIFDPAIYFGDRECDLAMTELFGGFSPSFYAAYEDVYPIESGYKQRKVLYNLYHVLNHANLFGGHYVQQSKNIMCQLVRSVS